MRTLPFKLLLVGFVFSLVGCTTLTPNVKKRWDTETLPSLKATAQSTLDTLQNLTLGLGSDLVTDLSDLIPNLIEKFKEITGLSKEPEVEEAVGTLPSNLNDPRQYVVLLKPVLFP